MCTAAAYRVRAKSAGKHPCECEEHVFGGCYRSFVLVIVTFAIRIRHLGSLHRQHFRYKHDALTRGLPAKITHRMSR